MISLDIVIPTYGRPDKLRRALASVHTAMRLCNAHTCVNVFYSDEKEHEEMRKEMVFPWLQHCLLPNDFDFRAPVFWNNYLRTMYADALVYLTDDVLLDQYCLLIGLEEIQKMDFDGVVGFNIENKIEQEQPCLAAFGIIGKKFADRFPKRSVFCPDYYSLFSDVELQRYAQGIKKFKFHTACRLVHFHPAYDPDSMDATHVHTRRRIQVEADVYQRRQAKNLVWGESFELINKEEMK